MFSFCIGAADKHTGVLKSEEQSHASQSFASSLEDLPRELLPASALEKRFNLPHYDAKAADEVNK